MKKIVFLLMFFFGCSIGFSQQIVGKWIRTVGCPNGDKMTEVFKSDGTGYITVPDCNRVCAPYEYTMTFNWRTSGNTLTIEYLSVSEYCGVKQPSPGTFNVDYEVSADRLRVVQDIFIRQ